MRKFAGPAVAALLVIVAAGPALAAGAEDCHKAWSAYDINREGVLRGTAAQQFYDDMNNRGIAVGKTKDGTVSAKQYMRACTTEFWQDIDNQTGG